MTDSEISGDRTPGRTPRHDSNWLSPGLSQLLAGVLLVALALSVVWAVAAYKAQRGDGPAQVAQRQAMEVATQFALRMDTFNAKNLQKYSSSVQQLLTTNARSQFKQTFPAFQSLYVKGKAVGSGTVRAVGVSNIAPDSATILVIHDRSVTSTLGDQKQYLRWSVSLDRIGGRWLVDKFSSN